MAHAAGSSSQTFGALTLGTNTASILTVDAGGATSTLTFASLTRNAGSSVLVRGQNLALPRPLASPTSSSPRPRVPCSLAAAERPERPASVSCRLPSPTPTRRATAPPSRRTTSTAFARSTRLPSTPLTPRPGRSIMPASPLPRAAWPESRSTPWQSTTVAEAGLPSPAPPARRFCLAAMRSW